MPDSAPAWRASGERSAKKLSASAKHAPVPRPRMQIQTNASVRPPASRPAKPIRQATLPTATSRRWLARRAATTGTAIVAARLATWSRASIQPAPARLIPWSSSSAGSQAIRQ
jgi:hypothetical protein